MENSKKRVITAIVMGVVIIPFLFLGGYFFYGLMAFLGAISTFEIVRMYNNSKGNKPIILNFLMPLFSLILIILIMVSDYLHINNGIKIIVFSALVIITFLLIISLLYKEISVSDSFFYIGSIIYGGIPFGLMGVIRNSSVFMEKELMIGSFDVNIFNICGLCIFLFVLFTNMFTDIFAYEVGRRIGKKKLIPDVSPNKTVEGSIFGTLIGSILGAAELILCEYLLGFNLFKIANPVLNILVIFVIAVVISICSQFGDLIASKLKREYGIKDYGNIFPGHGGVMDRFDSLILTSTLFFLLLVACGVIV